jgi:hypothetical protein
MIGRSLAAAAVGVEPNTAGFFRRGALRYVITSMTPGAASAALVSSVAIRPLGIVP